MMAVEWLALLAAGRVALEVGLLRALWQGPGTAEELAGRTGCDARALGRVLDVLATTELVERQDGAYALPSRMRAEFAALPTGFEGAARVFEHVATLARTGEPIACMDGSDHQRAEAYIDLVGELGAAWTVAAREVARALAPVRGTVLDIGAGSGVWSLALAALSPEARVVAVDLAPVLAQFRERAARSGLAARVATVEGSWFEVDLPHAELALLANVLHLEEEAGARRLLGRVAAVARRIAIVDVLDGPDLPARRRHAAYQLHLAARTRAGAAHGRVAVARLLDELGYAIDRELPARTEETSLTCLIASRREA